MSPIYLGNNDTSLNFHCTFRPLMKRRLNETLAWRRIPGMKSFSLENAFSFQHLSLSWKNEWRPIWRLTTDYLKKLRKSYVVDRFWCTQSLSNISLGKYASTLFIRPKFLFWTHQNTHVLHILYRQLRKQLSILSWWVSITIEVKNCLCFTSFSFFNEKISVW